jgi:hypothetical protein
VIDREHLELAVLPDDPEPTRRRGCSYSVLPYLVVALVVLWWRL